MDARSAAMITAPLSRRKAPGLTVPGGRSQTGRFKRGRHPRGVDAPLTSLFQRLSPPGLTTPDIIFS